MQDQHFWKSETSIASKPVFYDTPNENIFHNNTPSLPKTTVRKFREIMTNQLHKCYICDQDYFQYELEVHFVIHHSKDSNQINLESMKNSETEELYKCSACKRSFANKSKFETHILDKSCLKCVLCKRTFFSAFNLKRHNKLKHHNWNMITKRPDWSTKSADVYNNFKGWLTDWLSSFWQYIHK